MERRFSPLFPREDTDGRNKNQFFFYQIVLNTEGATDC